MTKSKLGRIEILGGLLLMFLGIVGIIIFKDYVFQGVIIFLGLLMFVLGIEEIKQKGKEELSGEKE